VAATPYALAVPPSRLIHPAPLRSAATVLALTLLALSGCHSARPQPGAAPRPSTTGPAKSAPPVLSSFEQLLAKLPKFLPAPPAVPVNLPDGASAPIYHRLPVNAKVAFLTIDDGFVQLPKDLAVMKRANIPFTMFLIGPVAAKNPKFFKELVGYGGVIEDHTMTHPELRGKPYAYQKNQICGARSTLTKAFGTTPTLFRPPFGDYDATTLKAVHDCGLRAAFHWSETARNGKVFYQTSVHKIQPGDIILMHFRDTFAKDVLAALTAIHKAGLTPALLEDYIGPSA
jgi:peptidoglycan/xylan/chitin deacetylase (PgdA/CDA1 family)